MIGLFRNLIFIFLLCTCSPEKQSGMTRACLPEKNLLKKGVANKFYMHGTPQEGFPFTDIRYELYSRFGENEIKIESFNAGFEKIQERIIKWDSRQLTLLKETHYSPWDTVSMEIKQNGFLPLKINQTRTLEITGLRQGRFQKISTERTYVKDTIIFNKPAYIIKEDFITKTLGKTDTVINKSSGKILYMDELGLFSSFRMFNNMSYRYELVEQMPASKFNKLRDHNRKRVAYIDPSATLDKGSDFKLCNPEPQIYDYYNSYPPGGFLKGKNEMASIISSRIDKKKLLQESGYFTLRFVVNCNGEAGRFVTEETSLDFEKKKFHRETANHLYDIVKGLGQWRPVTLDKPVDGYFYITFKLEDGELKEILP
jgi:hypothetical protein